VTKYRLLASSIDEETKTWKDWGTIDAESAQSAVRAGYMRNPDGAVKQLVAVPERSWKPTMIRTESVTRVVIGEHATKED